MTTPKRTADFFDSYAYDFSAIYGGGTGFLHRLVSRHFRKSMMLRYSKTLEGCDPIEGRTVIDIGCGPGHYGIALAKKGAGHVLGIDFAQQMIWLARDNAAAAGVGDVCEFVCDDFMTYPINQQFDYSVVMGFMDYVTHPAEIVARALAVTKSKAFFSFPAEGGLLAWQRKLRYRRRCDLYMYRGEQLERLFAATEPARVRIEKIERDYFVTVVRPDFPRTR